MCDSRRQSRMAGPPQSDGAEVHGLLDHELVLRPQLRVLELAIDGSSQFPAGRSTVSPPMRRSGLQGNDTTARLANRILIKRAIV